MFTIKHLTSYAQTYNQIRSTLLRFNDQILTKELIEDISEVVDASYPFYISACLLDTYAGLKLNDELIDEISFLYSGNLSALKRGEKIRKCIRGGVINTCIGIFKKFEFIADKCRIITRILSGSHAGDLIFLSTSSERIKRFGLYIATRIGMSIGNKGKLRYYDIHDLIGKTFKAEITRTINTCRITEFKKSSTCYAYNLNHQEQFNASNTTSGK